MLQGLRAQYDVGDKGSIQRQAPVKECGPFTYPLVIKYVDWPDDGASMTFRVAGPLDLEFERICKVIDCIIIEIKRV